ncbi:DHH family phosphoesterase [Candidatus Micrarchaeota archaeon]|nr:DHH family phosphoesterase [Candidatus Micrarchaeota archaeon]
MGFNDFLEKAEEVRRTVEKFKNPLVVHHYDCDGITSGAITIKALQNMNKPYRNKVYRKLDETAIEELKTEKEIIFVDLGGGTELVNELKEEIVIIDHHQTKNINHLQINPELFGYDGCLGLSASGAAYFTFKTSSDLAIVGALGDVQYPFKELNLKLLDESIQRKEIEKTQDITLYGRGARPLIQFLLYSDDPYLPGISNNENGTKSFLESTGLILKNETSEKWKTYYDLNADEKKILITSLISYLCDKNLVDYSKKLIGEVYLLKNRPKNCEMYDAVEFSTILNACGRNNRTDIGLGVCLEHDKYYEDAKNLLLVHRKNLREGVQYAKNHIEDFGKFYFIDARGIIDESIIGVVAGMLLSKRDKPLIAASLDENGNIKFSSRLLDKESELNLGKILKEVSIQVGGIGGGHKYAAGCTIPNNKINEFLLELNKHF